MEIVLTGTSSYLIDNFTLHTGTGLGGERAERHVFYRIDLRNITQVLLGLTWNIGPDTVQFMYYVNGYLVFDTGWLDFGGNGSEQLDITRYLLHGDNRFTAILMSPYIRVVDRYATYTSLLMLTWTGDVPPGPPEPIPPPLDVIELLKQWGPLIAVGTVAVVVTGYFISSVTPLIREVREFTR